VPFVLNKSKQLHRQTSKEPKKGRQTGSESECCLLCMGEREREREREREKAIHLHLRIIKRVTNVKESVGELSRITSVREC
jgi:hypothetical protein